MEYFFVHASDVEGSRIVLKGDEAKHLARVLRKTVGDTIRVTDGMDHMYEAVVRSISHGQVECEILEAHDRVNEPRADITLGVSLLKNPSRFDFVVEKATELGVKRFIPLMCERTIHRREKQSRLQKIAIAAMKQCGRSYLPQILPAAAFSTLVDAGGEYDLKLIPHEKTEQSQFVASVRDHHPRARTILVVVGPEGGFTDAEIRRATQTGFVPISLGPRRLRSETAAVATIAHLVGGW